MFSLVALPIYIPTNNAEGSLFSTSLPTLVISYVLDNDHSKRIMLSSHCHLICTGIWLVFKFTDSFFHFSSLLLNPSMNFAVQLLHFFSSMIFIWYFFILLFYFFIFIFLFYCCWSTVVCLFPSPLPWYFFIFSYLFVEIFTLFIHWSPNLGEHPYDYF